MTDPIGQPPYQRVISGLLQGIAQGTYPVAKKIPTTDELMVQYGVSQTPARQAVRDLQRQGILKGIPGSGVFVERTPTEVEVNQVRDVREHVTELDQGLRDLASKMNDEVAPDLVDLKRQVANLQAIAIDIYARLGWDNPLQQTTAAKGKRARSA